MPYARLPTVAFKRSGETDFARSLLLFLSAPTIADDIVHMTHPLGTKGPVIERRRERNVDKIKGVANERDAKVLARDRAHAATRCETLQATSK